MPAISFAGPLRAAPLRLALRPMLRTVLRRPGRLYQPLFIGPVADLEAAEAEVQAVADQEGVPLCFARDGALDALNTLGGASVVVLAPGDAERLLGSGAVSTPGFGQVVILSAEAVTECERSVESWARAGLVFDPAALGPRGGREWSMGPTLARCARDPGRLYNPVVLEAPRAALPLVGSEAGLRLEAAGLAPVLVLGAGVDDPAGTVQRLTRRGAVVLDGPAVGIESALATIREASRSTRQLVILGDGAFLDELFGAADAAALLDGGMRLLVSSPETEVRERAPDPADAFTAWPPAHQLLVGAPPQVAAPTRVFTGHAAADGAVDGLSLGGTLQMISLQSLTGRLVVYAKDKLGVVHVERGRVIHAQILGDPWSAVTLAVSRASAGDDATTETCATALVVDRCCRIAGWTAARLTFVSSEAADQVLPSERVTLAADDVLLECVKRQDEAPRRNALTGGMDRVWRTTGARIPEQQLPALAVRLWQRLAGDRPLADVAAALGLLDDEALDAVQVLVLAGAVESSGDAPPRPSGVPTHQVASQLLHWGLSLEARAVLEEAMALGVLAAEGHRLLAHLWADTEPEAAADEFRQVVQALDRAGSDALDDAFNLALLEVRGRQVEAALAWERLLDRLRRRGAQPLSTERHYAICAELAMRASDAATARQMLDAVGAFATPTSAALQRALRDALSHLSLP